MFADPGIGSVWCDRDASEHPLGSAGGGWRERANETHQAAPIHLQQVIPACVGNEHSVGDWSKVEGVAIDWAASWVVKGFVGRDVRKRGDPAGIESVELAELRPDRGKVRAANRWVESQSHQDIACPV
jgi:hypothetical protein